MAVDLLRIQSSCAINRPTEQVGAVCGIEDQHSLQTWSPNVCHRILIQFTSVFTNFMSLVLQETFD